MSQRFAELQATVNRLSKIEKRRKTADETLQEQVAKSRLEKVQKAKERVNMEGQLDSLDKDFRAIAALTMGDAKMPTHAAKSESGDIDPQALLARLRKRARDDDDNGDDAAQDVRRAGLLYPWLFELASVVGRV